MSSLPLLYNILDDLERGSSYIPNDFGVAIHPHHLKRGGHQPMHHYSHHQAEPLAYHLLPLALMSRLGGSAPAAGCQLAKKDCAAPAAVGKDGFQVCMDVGQFKPSELSVKVVNDHIVIEGRHEERQDNHGYISRHFKRRYSLPKDFDADKVLSTLSSDGVLTVSVPKPQLEDKNGERVVQIQQVGPAHLNVKENEQEKVGDAAADTKTSE